MSTSKKLLQEAAALRAKARKAEKAELEAFGKWAAELFAPDVSGVTDRIQSARSFLESLVQDSEEPVGDSLALVTAHEFTENVAEEVGRFSNKPVTFAGHGA